MKKFALIVILALAMSVPAFAAEATTALTLQVGAEIHITPSPSWPTAITLNNQVGPTEVSIGTFTISSNQNGTFNYTIASQNTAVGAKGFLKGTNTGTLFAYEIKFADMAAFAAITTDKTGTISVTANVNSVPELKFKYGDSTGLPADTYTDSIKVTIVSAG